jgi:hypothetical protein
MAALPGICHHGRDMRGRVASLVLKIFLQDGPKPDQGTAVLDSIPDEGILASIIWSIVGMSSRGMIQQRRRVRMHLLLVSPCRADGWRL